ncbi:aquaporin NIP6-1-like [Vigna radiata var. radiata]|uniref:Aquaporin NIP6-1-like n=1 Tax=Vigna radiata var. radiata TaxID=3916 RepID=A0A1S3W0B2_VIGRR|nr:aquaporin NIP6-1-like [Vigna radiata var. radiata]
MENYNEIYSTRVTSFTSGASFRPYLVTLKRKVAAEFIGTFIIIFTTTATAIFNHNSKTLKTLNCVTTAGLTVMVFIFATGHISMVTFSFVVLKHFPWKHVPIYIGAQVLTSVCAAFALKGVYHPFMNGGVTVPLGGYGQSFALEFIITFNLMFDVTTVATDTKSVRKLAGIALGDTVMLNILITGPVSVSGGSMNLVRTLGLAIATNNYKDIWIYMIAPVLGALASACTYTAVKLPKECESKSFN